ncbi:MAG: hypothetical protein ACOCQ5_06135 [Halanaerobiales bacterium]
MRYLLNIYETKIHQLFSFTREVESILDWFEDLYMNHGDGLMTTDAHPNGVKLADL